MSPRAWAAAAVLAACAAAYHPLRYAGFAYDDHIYVEDNSFVQDPANLRVFLDPRFYLADQGLLAGSRPVFLASLLADRAVWGSRPAGYHLTSLLLHAANALCVSALGAGLGLGLFGGTLAGLLFAVQPLLSEAVCGVSFRPDLLAALFAFAAVMVLRGAWALERRAFLARTAAATALFLLSLMSKESAALAPLAAFLPAPPRRRAVAALLALAAAGLVYAAFRAPRFQYALGLEAPRTQADHAGLRILPPEAPRWQYAPSPPPWRALYADAGLRARTMSAETGAALLRLVRPGRPTVERLPVLRPSWASPAILGAWLVLAALAAAAFLLRRRSPPASAGAAWVLAALVPVCGLVPLYNPTADRYLYLPMAGAAWALAALILALAGRAQERRREAALALTALLALPWLTATRRRAAEWESDKTLFAAEAGAPQGPRVPYNRAIMAISEGRAADAEAELLEALRRHPGFTEAWSKLGALYDALGDAPRARAAFARGAAEPSPSPLPAYAFARFLERRGERAAAAAVYQAALERDPGFAPARAALTGKP
ncbi:MAG: hypothetical protein HYZ75_07855 [Elusimicrobia bacterium]|nr:hypothetical protein [Elusimicrobiota bacterium]